MSSGGASLVAWDPVQQREAWRVAYPRAGNGGTLSTGGRLVFQGSVDGYLNAYAADTGTKLWSYDAQKGNYAVSILFGAFVAYCNFNVYINQLPDGNTGVSIVRNKPWWTGVIGVKRVKNRADELGKAIGGALHQQNFSILAHQMT